LVFFVSVGLLDIPMLGTLDFERHCCTAHFFRHARSSCAASAPGVYALKMIRLVRSIGFVIDNLAIATS